MSREEKELLFEDFDFWLKTRFTDVFWLKGHRFERAKSEHVFIDGGRFSKEEAMELFRMLTSRNPFTRLSATVFIWERNNFLVKVLAALAILAVLLIYIWVRR